MQLMRKKMIIIDSDQNELVWGGHKKESHCISILGVRYSTLRRWARGDSRPKGKGIEQLCIKINNHCGSELNRSIEPKHFRYQVGIHDFACIFGIDRRACNKILDEALYSDAPLFPAFYYETEEAHDLFRSSSGLYQIYRGGITGPKSGYAYVIGLHVREMLQVSEKSS